MKKRKYEDPKASLGDMIREDARMADKAGWLSMIAIAASLLSLAPSLLRLLLLLKTKELT